MNHPRTFVNLGLTVVLLGCGGAAPAPVSAPSTPQGVPTASTAAGGGGPVEVPKSLAGWLHVESPGRLAPWASQFLGPGEKDASCGKGDLQDCLTFVDASRPFDLAAAPSDTGEDVQAFAFSVHSVAEFRSKAEASFLVVEGGPGLLMLDTRPDAGGSSGKDSSGAKKKDPTILCDVGNAGGSNRVVCGNKEGLTQFGPWLRTSPRPSSTDDLARLELYPVPLVGKADKALAGDNPRDKEVRQLAHDVGGATVKLEGSDKATGQLELDLDVHFQSSQSRWTKVLLTPPTGGGALPDTFARLPRGTTAAVAFPGGGPMVALLGQLGSLDAFAALDLAKTKPALDEVRAIVGRPIVCGYVLDFDEAHAVVGRLRAAPPKDEKKEGAMLNAAFDGHLVCGIQEPIRSAEQLVRKLAALAAVAREGNSTVRSAANLGLPRGSFLVHAMSANKETAGKKTAAKIAQTLFVPDGDTTWIISSDSGEDAGPAAHLAKRLLQRPAGISPTLAVGPGTLATGYVSSLLGAFFSDLMTRSLDPLDATLATSSPGLFHVALAQRIDGSGGTVSLAMQSDVATVKALAPRAMVLGGLGMLALGVLGSDSGSSSK